MMKICLLLSAGILAVGLVWAWLIYPRIRQMPRAVSALSYFTISVFLAGVLLFLPARVLANWPPDVPGRVLQALRGGLVAIGDSMRLFVMGSEWNDVRVNVVPKGSQLGTLTGVYCAFLYFLAPALTFGTVLHHFLNVFGAIYLRISHFRRIYLMSALNVQSVAIAEEIAGQRGKWGSRPLIVFADVFAREEEEDYELRRQAKAINAICLKRDISHLRFSSWGKPVEIFLLDENEAENLAQVRALTEAHREKPRDISIYVYASTGYSEYILDSLDKGEHLLHKQFVSWVRKNPEDVLYHSRWMEQSIPMGGNFTVQRLDPVDMLVKKVLTWDRYGDYRKIFEEAPEDRVIHMAILGMGRYGRHFFKTAAWFYQQYGYCVKFHVFDLQKEPPDPEKQLMQECPELVRPVRFPEQDDAQYEIRFFPGTDCLSGELAQKIRGDEELGKIQLVLVALGDDDRNIQAAMNVRQLFEQLYMETTGKPMEACRPFIYALIEDERKYANLCGDGQKGSLVDYRGQNYEIRFVGMLEAQYSYGSIKTEDTREETAFKCHLDWLRKESQLRRCYEDAAMAGDSAYLRECRRFRRELEKEQAGVPVSWNDGDLFRGEDGMVHYDGPVNTEALLAEAKKYMRYAYFRNSSMAKALHKEALAQLLPPEKGHSDICGCDRCITVRITEHMRWNAYTRSMGYRRNSVDGKNRSRAKLHGDLRPWKDIPCRERYKD